MSARPDDGVRDGVRRGFVLTTHVGLEGRVIADLRAFGLTGVVDARDDVRGPNDHGRDPNDHVREDGRGRNDHGRGQNDHVRDEVRHVHDESPASARDGRVYVDVDDSHLPALLSLRSIHHVVRARGARRFETLTLEALAAWAGELAIPELEAPVSFVVRCEREGEHPFSSPEVERAVGGALAARYARPVDLKQPDVRIAVDVVGASATLDVRLTEPALSHRAYPRPYQQRTALKADVAYACLRAAEDALGRAPTRVIDPFCGSGTILLEAAELFPDARLFGSDKKPFAAVGAAANLAAFGHASRATIVTAELDLAARRLGLASNSHPTITDVLVTNPPYGVRMGARLDFRQLYTRIFRAFDVPVRVVLATEVDALREAADALGLRVDVVAQVKTGSVCPALALIVPR